MIDILPDFIGREALLVPSVLLLKSLSNIAFTGIMFAGIILVYYLTKLKHVLHKFAPYGRMSLTNDLSQSLIGGFLFYNWGLGLYLHTGITACILIGVCVFFLRMGNKRIKVVLFIVHRLTDTEFLKFLIQFFYLLPNTLFHNRLSLIRSSSQNYSDFILRQKETTYLFKEKFLFKDGGII